MNAGALAGLQRFADEHLLQLAVGGFDQAVEDFAGRAVDADRIAFPERHAFARERAGVVVDVNIAGAGDADLAHLAGDERRVAGNAAAASENAFGGDHAAQIFRAGFDAGQHDFLALVRPSASALLALNTTLPEAAPGPAAKPVAIRRPSFLACS